MIKAWLGVGLIVVVLLSLAAAPKFSDLRKDMKDVPVSQNPQASLHPQSIDALRKRQFFGSAITVETDLGIINSAKTYVVSYKSDGLKLNALMLIPTSPMPEGGYPVALINHGYIEPKNYSTTDSYRTTSYFFVSRGYLVLKPDYRGHAQSQGSTERLDRLNFAVDVMNLISSIPSLKEANPKKIFMYGHSMGGEVTLRVLEISDKVKAATLWAPAITQFPENLLYFIRKNRPHVFKETQSLIEQNFSEADYSAVSSLDNLKSISTPIIIHHGTADESVPIAWSEALDQKLTEAGKLHEFYVYQGEDHNFTRGNWSTAEERDLDFFKTHL